ECIDTLNKEGYSDPFNCMREGTITAEDGTDYTPDQVKVVSFYRFEGMSDPEDSSILYDIETNDGKKGYLVNGYGISANHDVSDFIKNVEEKSKYIGNKQPKLWKRFKNWFSK